MVSIVMPYYNGSRYVKEAVDSILAQSYKDWELLLVDDCSTEPGTAQLLQKIASQDERIKLLKTKKNGGAGIARNVAIEAAQGRYIAFCDSDDWWYPQKLETQMKFMEEGGYEFVCSHYEEIDEKQQPFHNVRLPKILQYNNMLTDCSVGPSGVVYDTQRIGKKFMPELRNAEDWGFWLILLKETEALHVCQQILWKYRNVATSTSKRKWEQLKGVVKMYQNVLHFSPIKTWCITLFLFLPRNILKKIKKRL